MQKILVYLNHIDIYLGPQRSKNLWGPTIISWFFIGLDLIYNEEQEKQFEDEKRLLQSQVNLERRKLEAEQERLRQESVKLEAEKAKLKEERKRLAVKSMSEESTTSTTSAGDSSSLESSSSATGRYLGCALKKSERFA